jgi:hypothetical protein
MPTNQVGVDVGTVSHATHRLVQMVLASFATIPYKVNFASLYSMEMNLNILPLNIP